MHLPFSSSGSGMVSASSSRRYLIASILIYFTLLLLPFATCTTNAEENIQNLIQQNNNLEQKELPPQNISNYYRGNWYREDGSLYESFKEKGLFTLHAAPTETILKEYHFIEGEAAIRDGAYLHHKQYQFALQGVYSKYTGHFWFYLVPPSLLLTRIQGPKASFNDSGAQLAYELGMRHRMLKMINEQLAGKKLKEDSVNTCIYKGFMIAENKKLDEIDFNDDYYLDNLDESKRPKWINLNGFIVGLNCNSSMKVEQETMSIDSFFSRMVNYTLMVTFVSFIEAVVLIHQMNYTRTQTSSARISLLSMAVQAIIDSYICLMHLTVGVFMDSVFKPFAVAAFGKLVLFSVFEMKYLFVIHKARVPNGFGGNQNVRREIQQLYLRFYLGLIAGLIVMYQLNYLIELFLFVLYSFWLPQIYCSISRNASKPLSPIYIIGTSLCRLTFPLYLFGCPYNFVGFKPNVIVCVCLVLWVALQAAILLLQHFFGPRFFVPKALRPAKYDYARPIPTELLEGGETNCVICMTELDFSQSDNAITPCNHIFHRACLKRWMEEKMECPSCRFALPDDPDL